MNVLEWKLCGLPVGQISSKGFFFNGVELVLFWLIKGKKRWWLTDRGKPQPRVATIITSHKSLLFRKSDEEIQPQPIVWPQNRNWTDKWELCTFDIKFVSWESLFFYLQPEITEAYWRQFTQILRHDPLSNILNTWRESQKLWRHHTANILLYQFPKIDWESPF